MDLTSLFVQSLLLFLFNLLWTIVFFGVVLFILKKFKRKVAEAIKTLVKDAIFEMLFDVTKDLNNEKKK